MWRIGEAFYGRQAAYGRALEGEDAELAAALARNVFAGLPAGPGAAWLAKYSRLTLSGLDLQNALHAGKIAFPDPQQIPDRAR